MNSQHFRIGSSIIKHRHNLHSLNNKSIFLNDYKISSIKDLRYFYLKITGNKFDVYLRVA